MVRMGELIKISSGTAPRKIAFLKNQGHCRTSLLRNDASENIPPSVKSPLRQL
jgi:hypothetical protein